MLDINVSAVIRSTYIATYYMKKLNVKGCIINLASLGGIYPMGIQPCYSSSKHGCLGFTRSCDYLYKEADIRVNAICPGWVETPLFYKAWWIGEKPAEGELVKRNLVITDKKVA